MHGRLTDLEARLREAQAHAEEAEGTICELTRAQGEMRGLIEQERAVYNEERERLEGEVQRAKLVAEAKIRLVRNRLMPLYDGSGDNQDISLEELIEHIVMRDSRFKRNPQLLKEKVALTRSSDSRSVTHQRLSANRSFDEAHRRSPMRAADPFATQ